MRCFTGRSVVRQFAAAAVSPMMTLRCRASTKPAEPEVDLPPPCEKTKKIETLEAKLKETEERLAEAKKDILYQAAETENARRIGREDIEKARNYSVTSFSKDMLDVVDTLEKGVEAFDKLPKEQLENNKQLSAIYTGVKMSSNVLLKNLSKHGVEKMAVKVGDKFNPNQHEALFKTPTTDTIKADHISNVLKTGYNLKERVLRAAQVGVAEDQ